ncbi:MAG: hypothetical protein CM15mP47_5120 [Methanobacteriota archaeon]|nr:MAG: hypothetical protein CM15mP47_5120 [Euryarchaeota archaeon]
MRKEGRAPRFWFLERFWGEDPNKGTIELGENMSNEKDIKGLKSCPRFSPEKRK